jgi:hypothetical protein
VEVLPARDLVVVITLFRHPQPLVPRGWSDSRGPTGDFEYKGTVGLGYRFTVQADSATRPK